MSLWQPLVPAYGRGLDALISDLLLSEISSSSSCLWPKAWRVRKKTHASSPSTSGKTHEKTCPIQTRRETTEQFQETKCCLTIRWSGFYVFMAASAADSIPSSGENPFKQRKLGIERDVVSCLYEIASNKNVIQQLRSNFWKTRFVTTSSLAFPQLFLPNEMPMMNSEAENW